LPELVLVARHSSTTVDHLREEAIQKTSTGAGNRRAIRRRKTYESASALGQKAARQLAELLPAHRSHGALVREGAHPASAQDGDQSCERVDARTIREIRWPGRDLSGHVELNRGPAVPGLLPRRSATDP